MKICVAISFQVLCIVASTSLGQVLTEEQRSRDSIDRANQLMLDYTARRTRLPTRWAAIVRCDYQSTPDAEENVWYKSLSFTAVDTKKDCKLEWRRHVDFQSQDDSFPSEWGGWRKGKQYFVRDEGQWFDYKSRPKTKVETIDPLSVISLNDTTRVNGISDTLVESKYFASFRECIGSIREDTSIIGIWSVRDLGANRHPAGDWIRFDEKGNPLEYVHKLYQRPTDPRDWNPDVIDPSNGKTMIRNSLEYKSFAFKVTNKEGTEKTESLHLPTSVLSSFTYSPNEGGEMVTSIAWKFGDDVPDSIFEPPQGFDFPVLEFEGIDMVIDE